MRVGTIVEIVGLQGRPEYNGLHAVVRSREETGRFKCVLVDASKTLLLKPENIKQVPLSELKPVQEVPTKPAASAMTPNGKLALQLVKGAVMSSAWKLRSLQAGKKLCEGCDCHLNDPKKSPSTTTAGNVGHMLTADMLKGMDLPPETLAQFSAMMSDKSAPTIIGFDGLVEGGSVSVSPDAMLDEDIDKLVSNLNGGMYPWREKIHAVLRFRISGHIVEPADFKDEEQLILINEMIGEAPSLICAGDVSWSHAVGCFGASFEWVRSEGIIAFRTSDQTSNEPTLEATEMGECGPAAAASHTHHFS